MADRHLGGVGAAVGAGDPERMLRTVPLLVLSLLATAAPAVSAAPPPPEVRTFTLCAPFAYIDAPAPGRVFVGTIFKGEQFRVDRSARVATGPAKGLWRHGTRTARDDRSGRAYRTTGWVRASAFCTGTRAMKPS